MVRLEEVSHTEFEMKTYDKIKYLLRIEIARSEMYLYSPEKISPSFT